MVGSELMIESGWARKDSNFRRKRAPVYFTVGDEYRELLFLQNQSMMQLKCISQESNSG